MTDDETQSDVELKRGNEEMEFEGIEEFIKEAHLNLSVKRINNNGLISWKITHQSPLEYTVTDPDDGSTELSSREATIIIEFPREYPYKPPVVYCSDSTQHPFLGEGNIIPFRRLRDENTWKSWIPVTVILAGVHDLFISYLSPEPENHECAPPEELTKKPNYDMKIPETAVDKFLETIPYINWNRGHTSPGDIPKIYKMKEYFKLYDDQDELEEVDRKLAELKFRRRKLMRSVDKGLQNVAGLPGRAERRRNQEASDEEIQIEF